MDPSMSLESLLGLAALLAGAGVITGVLAGLFGIGGGAILVPVLIEFLNLRGVDPAVQTHIAVGTSLAIIIPTSIRSYLSHLKRGAPDTALLKSWVVIVPLGVMAASFVVADVSGVMLKTVFACIAFLMAMKMLFNRETWLLGSDLPGWASRAGVGFVIGFISTFMGIGGGNLNNLFMTAYGRSIHQAVATSAGLGMLIAAPGALGYMVAGWHEPGLPPFSLGYVNGLAFALIMPLTILTAPLGVRIAHGLPRRKMEILFGVFLIIVCARFFSSIVAP